MTLLWVICGRRACVKNHCRHYWLISALTWRDPYMIVRYSKQENPTTSYMFTWQHKHFRSLLMRESPAGSRREKQPECQTANESAFRFFMVGQQIQVLHLVFSCRELVSAERWYQNIPFQSMRRSSEYVSQRVRCREWPLGCSKLSCIIPIIRTFEELTFTSRLKSTFW